MIMLNKIGERFERESGVLDLTYSVGPANHMSMCNKDYRHNYEQFTESSN